MKIILILIIIARVVWADSAISFATKKITLGNKDLLVDVADSDDKRQQGLMYRKILEDGRGMLFVFDGEQRRTFWMKNTYVPLSIGFFDSKKVLVEYFDMEPASELDRAPKVYPSKKPAQYALEVPKGWFKKKGIKIGTKFRD
jgi:uncharacterized protein